MGAIHDEKTYAIKIRESANDGSDFSNPEADYRIAYIGEDGIWHLKDSAGTVTDLTGSGIPATIFDAKGDLIAASAADTAARLAAAANGATLVTASGEPTGLKWRLNNDGASAAPTVNDDSGDGYSIGSRWIDTTNDKEYVATDVSAGAAVWKETTATGSGGLSHAYVGYNTIGASWVTMTTRRVLMKKITLASAGFLASIAAHVRATGNPDVVGKVGHLNGHLYDDNAGTPKHIIAHGSLGFDGAEREVFYHHTNTGAGDGRWVDLAVAKYLAAGDYWLAVQAVMETANIDIAVDSGSGSDRYYLPGGGWIGDAGYTSITTTTDAYSVRGSILS